jgi:glycosyltransferase involved in cell wall biosynthesis
MKKLFTIAIPTRNRDQYLIETIDSIIQQDGFDDIEIVICNNSDEKSSILKEKYTNYKNIKYYENDKVLTIDENMIKVGSLVNTKYFLWLGDDDLIIDGGLKYILNLITNYDYDLILLNAMLVTENLDKKLGDTIEINKNLTYHSPKEFFTAHCFHMPFGTLIIKKSLFDSVLEESKRFEGTSHAYSGLVFDYLAKSYLINKQINIIVISKELIQLRQIPKTWKNNATKIMFQEIPEWFLLLDDFYKDEASKILTNYLNNQFKIKNLLAHRLKFQLSIGNFSNNTKYASFWQKVKYIIVGLIPIFRTKVTK